MTIASLIVSVQADTAQLVQGVAKVHGQLDGLSSMAGKVGLAMAGAFTLTAIVGAANKVFDFAGRVNDLSDQTGLTTKSIQEMQHAASLTSTSLESFTNAAFKLGTNLAGGGNSVRNAVEALGLSYAALRAQSPDEQFRTIATALGDVEDKQMRNKLAVDLFGKAAKPILAAIAQGYDEIADSAMVASDAQIDAADAFGDALSSFWDGLLAVGVTVLGSLFMHIKQTWKDAGDIANYLFFDKVKAGFETLQTLMPKIFGGNNLPKPFQEAAVAASLLPKPLEDITLSLIEQDRITKDLTASVAKNNAERQKQVEWLKQVAEGVTINGEGLNALQQAQLLYNNSLDEYVPSARTAEDASEAMWDQFYRLTDQTIKLGGATEDISASLGLLGSEIDRSVPDFNKWSAAFGGIKEGLAKTLNDIPQTIVNAFTGGGNILGAVKAIASSIGSTIGGNIGYYIGGPLGKSIGSAIGSLAGTLVGGIKKLFGFGSNEAAKQAAEAARKVAEEAAAALATQIEAMKGQITGFNSELDGLLSQGKQLGYTFDREGNLVSVSFEKMRDVAAEFGVDLAALGPAFQQQQIDAEARKIVDAFWMMERGGAQVGTILFGMQDEISKVVQDSLQFGTTIPANMEPWIKELLRAGLLTDSQGNKMTSLAGLQFSAPVEDQFTTIANAILAVIEKLNDTLGKLAGITSGLNGIPENVHSQVTIDTIHNDFYNSYTGETGGVPGFAGGTHGQYPDFGASGTLVKLHNRERVMTESEGRSEGSNDTAMLARMIRDLPRAIGIAFDDAMVRHGA